MNKLKPTIALTVASLVDPIHQARARSELGQRIVITKASSMPARCAFVPIEDLRVLERMDEIIQRHNEDPDALTTEQNLVADRLEYWNKAWRKDPLKIES